MAEYELIKDVLSDALELQLKTVETSKSNLDWCSKMNDLEEQYPLSKNTLLHNEVLYLKLLSEDAIDVYGNGANLFKQVLSDIEKDKDNAVDIFENKRADIMPILKNIVDSREVYSHSINCVMAQYQNFKKSIMKECLSGFQRIPAEAYAILSASEKKYSA